MNPVAVRLPKAASPLLYFKSITIKSENIFLVPYHFVQISDWVPIKICNYQRINKSHFVVSLLFGCSGLEKTLLWISNIYRAETVGLGVGERG
jgi:hypothetical protein